MNICFISYDYPDEKRSVFPFVKQLVDEIARQGHTCQVVAPYSITNNRRFHKFKETQIIGKGSITIYRPNYVSLSNLKLFGKDMTYMMQCHAISYALHHLDIKPDVIYGHFWQYGYAGYRYARHNDIPLFVASGESYIPVKSADYDKTDFLDYLSGVICVSTKNQDESVNNGLTTIKKCKIIPNGIDNEKFHVMDKQSCRKQIGINTNDFVVAFVGAFNERKGVLRVSDALKKIADESIKAIFIGGGEQNPDYEYIIFKGKLPHEDIAMYLNAADVFVLPTQAEGCCNAIIEAMACGLPIISSNLPFNWDVLNADNSIMINHNDVNEIAMTIKLVREDINKRKEMSLASIKTAERLTIEKRADAIIRFVSERMNLA